MRKNSKIEYEKTFGYFVITIFLILIITGFEMNFTVYSQSLEMQRTWGGSDEDKAMGIAVDSAGNVYIAGYTDSFGAGKRDGFIVKFDSNGNKIWDRTIGSNQRDDIYSIKLDNNGNIYVAGATNSTDSYFDAFIVKFDSNGNKIWDRTWGKPNSRDSALGLTVDSNGNIYVVGGTDITDSKQDAFILKLDPNGNKIWDRTWGIENSQEAAYSITLDSNGNVYLIGYTENIGVYSQDYFILKLDSNGNKIWDRTIGTSVAETSDLSINRRVDIALDSSGNIYGVGHTYSNNPRAYLFKFDANGNKLWDKRFVNDVSAAPNEKLQV
jgi:uncharacterized delta-60 repeat protein